MAELQRYLGRIGFAGEPRPDRATLRALHRLHLAAIPFEAIDAQSGVVPSMRIEDIFAKLVERRRGGWCYEMNGLFGWALEQIGFPVTRVSCGVMQHVGGEERADTHLALLVEADGRTWLADVGFGSTQAEPIPLDEGEHDHLPFKVGLSRIDGARWRFSEHSGGDPFSYDFAAAPGDESRLTAKCHWQATAADSNFVQNFVAMRRDGDDHLSLRGRVFTRRSANGAQPETLSSAEEFDEVLRTRFGIDHPNARALWPAICERHEALFGAPAS
ncbi:arylamine N-acetyltransferase family protein [Tsuneonella sp. HG222]